MSDVSLLTLRTRVQTLLNSTVLTAAQLNDLINLSIQHLIRVVTATGEKYYVTSLDFSLTAGQDGYALPDSVSHTLGVDIWLDTQGTRKVTMSVLNFDDRNIYMGMPFAMYTAMPMSYDLVGDKVMIYPKPQATFNFTLWYVPTPTPLVSDNDTWNFRMGWDDFVITDAAIQAADVEEIERPNLQARRVALEESIRNDAINRNQGQTHTGTDTTIPKFPFYWW